MSEPHAMLPASPPKRSKPARTIDYEDVDDIIGVAAEMSDLDAERLSVEDLSAIAKDLDIPERYIVPAVAELSRRRQAMLMEEARRRKRTLILVWSAVTVVALLLVWAFTGNAKLGALVAHAEAQRAQVVNVVERQAATQSTWGPAPESPERRAELAGAENRVRIARRQYDEAAAAYNAAVFSFPSSLWAGLFGHPDRLPLSSEIERF